MAGYPRVLQRVLGILFFGLLALTVLAAGLAVYFVTWGSANTSLSVPVSFVPDPQSVNLTSATYGDGTIVVAQGMAEFEQVGGSWHVARAIALVVVLLVPAFAILDLLRRLVGTVAEGRPFQPSNVRRIRAIGILVVGSAALYGLTTYLLERSIAAEVVARGVTLGSNFTVDVPAILLGCVIIALAEVFHYGMDLQTDSDLTV